MKRTSKKTSKKRPIRWVSFLDLSTDLDRSLSLVAHLSVRSDEAFVHQDELLPEVGYWIFSYLGKRMALEHVFLGRSLRGSTIDPLQLKAEVWRVEKIKARDDLGRS